MCEAPRRFEGNCSECGQFGHAFRFCAVYRCRVSQPHANVVTAQDAHYGGSYNVQQPIYNDAYDVGFAAPSSSQQQPQQRQVDEQTDGGLAWGGDGGVGQPEPGAGGQSSEYVGGDSGGWYYPEKDWNAEVEKERQEYRQRSAEIAAAASKQSSGGGDGGGGDDGDAGAPAGSYALSMPFGGGERELVSMGFMALQFAPFVPSSPPPSPSPSSPPRPLAFSLFPSDRPGTVLFLGDTSACVHAVPSEEMVFNRRQPLPHERTLLMNNGECMRVEPYGDLMVILRSVRPARDALVTLRDVAVTPRLALHLISLFRIQQQANRIILDEHGASTLDGNV